MSQYPHESAALVSLGPNYPINLAAQLYGSGAVEHELR